MGIHRTIAARRTYDHRMRAGDVAGAARRMTRRDSHATGSTEGDGVMARNVVLPPADVARPDGTRAGGWWHDEPDGRVVCDLCPRACRLKPGDRGFCFVRENRDGAMVLTTYGRSTGFCIDPIEKKPLNHFYPGSSVLSFGTAGCNLGCKFCQNWDISKSREVERLSERATPDAIAEAAVQLGCKSVAFTYNDPVVWAEYAIDTARACRARGIKTVAVTAGYIAPEAREPFFEVMDAANVDLKALSEQFYHEITYSHLQPVLDTLAWLARETDCWFEITNLLIPGANDSVDEIERLAEWVLNHCGDEVPLHFSAFHPDFRMRDRPATPHATLLMAHERARRAGLKHVYTGNVNDQAHQSTRCPHCNTVVIERNWYELGAYRLDGDRCRACGGRVAGRFDLGGPGNWGRRRQPVEIGSFAGRPDTQPAGGSHMASGHPSGSGQGTAAVATAPAERSTSIRQVDDSQRHVLLQAASELVAATILGRPVRLADPTLGGLADETVTGAYVTLKRAGHLRACTGNLGRTLRLVDALAQAAVHTATQDHRLPPISTSELPYLDISVNLLHSLSVIPARGQDRVAAVEVGRHGLRIQRGHAGGLLLPGVAVEHGWDSESFLRHLCRKAGLPSTAWADDETTIHTFESLEMASRLDAALPSQLEGQLPSAADLDALLRHARASVGILARGLTPTLYAHGLPDGQVAGLALTLSGSFSPTPWHFTRIALRPGVPLQATLHSLCESAAQAIQGLPEPPATVRLGLTVMTDPALHGNLDRPDLRGLDPGSRALLAMDSDRLAWTFAPGATADDLLATVRGRLGAHDPARSGLFSLAARSSEPRVDFDNAPRPVVRRGPRPPGVAGLFYPESPAELDTLVERLLPTAPGTPERWAAAMIPHAGLIYSGRIAAEVLGRLSFPRRVVVIGPKHTRLGVNWALSPHESWAIPGSELPADPEFNATLIRSIPGLELDAAAHQREHAIEVELPWLARLAPNSSVTGIVVGGGDWAHCQRFAAGLAAAIRTLDEPPLLLISSDMNHFATDRENRQLDALALHAMSQLDPRRLLDTVTEHDISMCGVIPAAIVMETLRELGGLTQYEQVAYGTSAEVTGDTSRVVGYAGVLLN
ncbi:MAG: AmmeMemoRadiSam system radical SAM enzyme [Isosphaeraceae bacterium]